METRRTNKGGRPALQDPAKHRHVLYLNDRENARFLAQWEQSGVTSKSRFIAARIFGEPFRVVKVGQLQPSGKSVARQLFGEKGTGFPL